MEASNTHMNEFQKINNFRLILSHAREWYDKADCKVSLKGLKLGLSRYFWKEFKFNPQTDDIEQFVREFQKLQPNWNIMMKQLQISSRQACPRKCMEVCMK